MNSILPHPILESEQLLLRSFLPADKEYVFALRSHPIVNQFIARTPPKSVEEIDAFLNKINERIVANSSFYWLIFTKDATEFCGTICIWNFILGDENGELGFELLPTAFGRNIMNEALGLVAEFAFNKAGFTSLDAYTHKENVFSQNLLVRKGFILNPLKKDDDFPNNLIYELHKSL
jgi:[ribosomal protein S5]-alanine N-acetyltransferase